MVDAGDEFATIDQDHGAVLSSGVPSLRPAMAARHVLLMVFKPKRTEPSQKDISAPAPPA